MMENTNNSFDKMMREAFSAVGTSHSFTRRLMVRIEKEKEIRRVARLTRIYDTSAVIVGVGLLVAAGFIAWEIFTSGAGVYAGAGIVDSVVVRIKTIWEQVQIPSLLISGFTLAMAVLVVLAFDHVMKKEYGMK